MGDVYTFQTQEETLDFWCEKLLKTAPNHPALSSLQDRVRTQGNCELDDEEQANLELEDEVCFPPFLFSWSAK